MKHNIEDINDPVLREIYTQEHDDAIKAAVEEITIEIQEQFHTHQNEIFEKFSKLNCETGKSYVDQEMTYNLITNLLEVLLSDCDQIGKEALRDMLDSDIAEMIYGPPTEEELAQAAKNDEECELCLNKENVADVLNRMSNAIKD